MLTDLFNGAELTPLYVRLIFNMVSEWPSHTDSNANDFVDNKSKLKNARQCIEYIFKRMEKRHGNKLVARILFYMSQFAWGISEKELVDILSLDKDLLESLDISREQTFPISIWISFKHEIQRYLSVKYEQELQVMCWRHELFQKVSKELYDDSIKDIEREVCLINIYKYFMANELIGSRKKPEGRSDSFINN